MKTKSRISKKQLQKHLDELIGLAKTFTPDVKAAFDIPGYEGQDAAA